MPNLVNILLILVFGFGVFFLVRRMRVDYPLGMLTRRHILDVTLGLIGLLIESVYSILQVSLVKPMQVYLAIVFILWVLDCYYLSSFHRFLNKPILPKSKDIRRF